METYILVEIGAGECLGKSVNQASTKAQKGLLVCTSSFPEAGAALMGAAGMREGQAAGRQAEAKLVFGRKYDQELCGLRRQQQSLISHSGCGNHPNVHYDVMEKQNGISTQWNTVQPSTGKKY